MAVTHSDNKKGGETMQGLISGWVAPVGIGVLCLVAAVILYTLGEKQWPWLILVLVVGASDALMTTPVGSWIHDAVTWINDESGALIGKFTGVVVGSLFSIAIGLALGVLLWKRKLNNWTYTTGALAPASLPLIPGIFGAILTAIVTFPVWLLSQGLGILFGWLG